MAELENGSATTIVFRSPPNISHNRTYSISEVAALVRRSRKTVLADVEAGLLTGRWGEIRTRSKSWQRGRTYTHVSQGWAFSGVEVQRYVNYRYACIGVRSPERQRGAKPSAAVLILDHGFTAEGAALELGIKVSSARKSAERERKKREMK